MKYLSLVLFLFLFCKMADAETMPHIVGQQENIHSPQAADYVKKGDEQFHLQNYQEAMQDYQNAVAIDHQLDYADEMLANCSANFQNYDDALAYAKKALAINPKNAQVHNDMGYYYRALKQYDESIKEFKIAIPLLPRSYSLYMAYKGLGDSYVFMRDGEHALDAYERAADLQPNDSQLLMKITQGLTYSRKYEEALSYAKRLEGLHPQDPMVFIIKGSLLTFLKRFDEAKENYQRALEIFQKSGNADGVNQTLRVMAALNQIQQGGQ